MLNEVKKSIPIAETVTIYDTDLEGLIEACKRDLALSGIKLSKLTADDPLFVRAVIFYCKAYFRNTDNSQRYEKAYNGLKTALSMAGDYCV